MAEIAATATDMTSRLADRDDAARTALSSFRCDGCGYGARRPSTPERCPMCGGTGWSLERRRSFTTDSHAPLSRALTA
jgi:rubrerythrin